MAANEEADDAEGHWKDGLLVLANDCAIVLTIESRVTLESRVEARLLVNQLQICWYVILGFERR
jgi:hypothetical protein